MPSSNLTVPKRSATAARSTTLPGGVVMMGADYRSLATVRSLGRRNIPVIVLSDGEQLLATTSRYVTKVVQWRKRGNGEDLEFLLRLSEREKLHGWMLMPTDDQSVALISRSHQQLDRAYTLVTPPWSQLKYVCDKHLLAQLAETLGIDHPWTICPRGRKELEQLDCSFPVIVKPSSREHNNALTSEKAWKASSRDELLRLYDDACRIMPSKSIMVQSWIPGGGNSQFSYAALCSEGQVLASIIVRRTRQFPQDFGRASTFVETIEDPGISAPAERLIAAIGLSGLVEVEFKKDPEGRFNLLDVNPRIWGWHSIGARAGVDFSYLLWQHANGVTIPLMRGTPGYKWMRFSTDTLVAVQDIFHGRLSARAWLRSLWADSAIFDLHDPLPGILEFPLLAYLVAGRKLRNFMRKAH